MRRVPVRFEVLPAAGWAPGAVPSTGGGRLILTSNASDVAVSLRVPRAVAAQDEDGGDE